MNMEKMFQSKSGYDRISELPESIRVHILSFLETREAVRTSILSSRWRALSLLLPNLDVNKYDIPRSLMHYHLSINNQVDKDDASRIERLSVNKMKEGFYAFLDRVLASSLEIDKLNLFIPGFGSDMISRLDQWVNDAVRRRVKEFELEVGVLQQPKYSLPRSFFISSSIMKLKLLKCDLNVCAKMDTMLPSLRELWLEDVILSEMVVGSLLHSCINVENINLQHCEGLKKLEIIGLMKLEKVNFEQYQSVVEMIKIVAPNLREFSYRFHADSYGDTCVIELDGCGNVKYLELHGSHLDDVDLDGFLEKLPLLETLFLFNCDSLAYVEIYNQHLVKLAIDNCRELVKVKADTPNLKFFNYAGEDPISFVSKGSALKLTNASLSLKPDFRGEKWFDGLIKLLAKLSHSEDLELDVANEKDLMIPETLRTKFRPPLYAVKQLRIELRLSRLKSPVEVIDSLLWLAPSSESISVSNTDMSSQLSIEFLYEKPLKGKKKCGCWKSSINCWRHSLKTVTIMNRGRAKDHAKLVNFFQKERIGGKVECFIKNAEPDYF